MHSFDWDFAGVAEFNGEVVDVYVEDTSSFVVALCPQGEYPEFATASIAGGNTARSWWSKLVWCHD